MTDGRKQMVLERMKISAAQYREQATNRQKAEAYILLNGTRIWPSVDAYISTLAKAAEDAEYVVSLIQKDIEKGMEERT